MHRLRTKAIPKEDLSSHQANSNNSSHRRPGNRLLRRRNSLKGDPTAPEETLRWPVKVLIRALLVLGNHIPRHNPASSRSLARPKHHKRKLNKLRHSYRWLLLLTQMP